MVITNNNGHSLWAEESIQQTLGWPYFYGHTSILHVRLLDIKTIARTWMLKFKYQPIGGSQKGEYTIACFLVVVLVKIWNISCSKLTFFNVFWLSRKKKYNAVRSKVSTSTPSKIINICCSMSTFCTANFSHLYLFKTKIAKTFTVCIHFRYEVVKYY